MDVNAELHAKHGNEEENLSHQTEQLGRETKKIFQSKKTNLSISHLVWTPCRDENSLPKVLLKCPRLYTCNGRLIFEEI